MVSEWSVSGQFVIIEWSVSWWPVGGVDGCEERRAIVRYLDAMIVVRVAAGIRQEREVAHLRLLGGACASSTTIRCDQLRLRALKR